LKQFKRRTGPRGSTAQLHHNNTENVKASVSL